MYKETLRSQTPPAKRNSENIGSEPAPCQALYD